MNHVLTIKTKEKTEFVNITKEIENVTKKNSIDNGICVIYIPHTTAGVTINESADPAVQKDILTKLEDLVPENGAYHHFEGNSDAHIKTLMTGSAVTIPVIDGKLALGTWQAIFFTEYDGPRNRKAHVTLLGH